MFTIYFGFHTLSLINLVEQSFNFVIFHDLEQLVEFLIRIPDRLRDTPKFLDNILTSSFSLLGQTFLSAGLFSSQSYFHYLFY